MIKELTLILFLTAIINTPSLVQSAEGHGSNCASCHTLSEKEASELLKRTGGTVKSIKQSPVSGMFELLMEKDGQQGIIFIDYAKKNLIQGLVINLESLQPVSAHAPEQVQPKQPTLLDIKNIPTESSIIIGNPKGTKNIYVFTDPDCPYCRKMHAELRKLEKIAPDVAIHIMLFPLGMHPAAYDKARIIVETRNRDILDKAFDGKEVPKPSKENSKAAIEEIIRFANANGITGTPTLVMPDGKIEVGMRDAETLKKMLDGK